MISSIDASSAGLREWAASQSWTEQPLLFIEWAMGYDGVAAATGLLIGLLLVQRRFREVALVLAVTFATRELTGLGKELFGRDRPAWQNPEGFLQSGSFPSAHAATVAALAALVIALRFGRRANIAAVAAVVVVCLDRLLLGRHYPTDLVAGIALGGGLVLVGVLALSLLPTRATETVDAEVADEVAGNAEERHPVRDGALPELVGAVSRSA